MRVAAPGASRLGHRRWAFLLAASALLHAAVLGGFAFRMPTIRTAADTREIDVALVSPPPFVRPVVIETAKPPPQTRLVVLDAPPRYAPEMASTGEAADAADLFGPVFADGLWPRPMVVKSEPCDPKDDLAAREACRRELVLIGLASDAAAGAKAQP